MRLPEAFLSLPLAHRALHDAKAGRPENSLSAAQSAISAGYGIEVDLQVSADGVAMVFHDATLDRLTDETGPVRSRAAAQLKTIELRDGHETIPALTDLLDATSGVAPLLLELKDQSNGRGGSDGVLERATVSALEGYGGPVAVMSFNPDMVANCQKLAPALLRGLTTCDFRSERWPKMPMAMAAHLREILDFDRVGASFISHDARDLSSRRVAELKAQAVPILCWTVRSKAEEAKAREVAENITFENYLPKVPR